MTTFKNLFSAAILSAAILPAFAQTSATFQNKRELLLSVLDQSKPNDYIPVEFFQHFGDGKNQGKVAVDNHIKYYDQTHADFVKLDYRGVKPKHVDVKTPADWKKVKFDLSVFDDQLNVIEALAKKYKGETFVLPTVFSPIKTLSQIIGEVPGDAAVIELINKDPEAVKPALEEVVKATEYFIREARKRGADGFYVSSIAHIVELGQNFYNVVRPYDKRVSEIAAEVAPFNILHICGVGYTDIDSYRDYPASVINFPTKLTYGARTLKQVSEDFGRPVFGGLDNSANSILATGTIEEVKREIDKVLANAPQNIIFGADCTAPDISYEKIAAIADYVHTWRQTHNPDGSLKK